MRLIISAVFLFCSVLGNAQNFNRSKIDSLLHYVHHNKKAMGSVAITQNGNTVYTQSFGYLEVVNRHRTNSETLYRIGSISKTFTATIILQLIDEDKLTLDTSLAKFFPSLPNADKITIEELLDHHSGLFNLTTDPDYGSYKGSSQSETDLLKRIKKLGPEFSPGEKYSYSNTNYILLSFIAEHIEQKEFNKILQERIAVPIRAKRLRMGKTINPKNNEALSYLFTKKGWQRSPQTNLSIPLGAGGIVATAKDVARFYSKLFNGSLLGPETLKNMHTMRGSYGLGLFKIPYRNKAAFGHSGRIDGFQSIAVYFPEEKTSVAVLLNGSQINPQDILKGILDIYFGYPYDFPKFSKLQNPERYTGTYNSEAFPMDVTIFSKNNELYGQATGQPSFPLKQENDSIFTYTPAGLTIKFRPTKNSLDLIQNGMTYKLTLKKAK